VCRTPLLFGECGELAAAGRVSATKEEAWVDYDTLYFMQQIDAVAQQSDE
jgi:hypothetical protein